MADGGLLQSWLGDVGLETFRDLHFGALPFALPERASPWTASCTWSDLDATLGARDPVPDVLVVARGQLVDAPFPRSTAALRRDLFPQGVGLVVRHAQRQNRKLAQLGAALAHDIPGEQRMLVFATPKGVHGFGWHYDAEEVFILQTAGIKDYYFRQNTIDPAPQRGAQPDFSRVREEKTPLMSCRLWPGDWLYLPRGTWHLAQPIEDSLSVSIGIFPAH